ncbi:hypothetical protein J4Q44_G00024350 [Coregonus suidteri]|uniref:C3H1-type domain-containing protein n=1 Tax=Coregonus suidteri TaxID=861788 RepID=A0AAN8M884_9TELE
MASEETGLPLDSAENLEDRRAQEHRSTEGPKTEVPARPSQDGPQVTAGQEEGAGVCQFFLLGKCRFGNRCRRSHSTPTLDDPEAVIDQENRKDDGEKEGKLKKKAKGSKTNQPKDTEGKESTKKPRMRTADDVISRILWDPSVEAADFVVGYVDRFLGVLERPFSEFNWDADPCDCDYSSELALPRHRIQYFTHRGRRVWDRNNRTDRVFGSTGQRLAPPFGQEEEQEQGTGTQDVKQQDPREEQDGVVTTEEGEESEEYLIKQDVENGHLEERNQSKTSVQMPESIRPGTGTEVTAAGEMLQRFAYLDRNPPVAVSFPLKLKHFGGKVLYLSPHPQPPPPAAERWPTGGLQRAGLAAQGLLHTTLPPHPGQGELDLNQSILALRLQI